MRSRQMLIKLGGLHLPATEAGCPDLIGCLAAVASSRLTMIFSRAGSDNPSAKAKRPCCQLANGSGAWPVRGRRGCRATFRSGRSVPASRPARGPPMRQTPPTGPPPEGLRRQAASLVCAHMAKAHGGRHNWCAWTPRCELAIPGGCSCGSPVWPIAPSRRSVDLAAKCWAGDHQNKPESEPPSRANGHVSAIMKDPYQCPIRGLRRTRAVIKTQLV